MASIDNGGSKAEKLTSAASSSNASASLSKPSEKRI